MEVGADLSVAYEEDAKVAVAEDIARARLCTKMKK
jgi:hypothetical protein